MYRFFVNKSISYKSKYYFATKSGIIAHVTGLDLWNISRSRNVIDITNKNRNKGFTYGNGKNFGTFISAHDEDDDDTTFVANDVLNKSLIIT